MIIWTDFAFSRSFDHLGHSKLNELCLKFDGLTEAHLALKDAITPDKSSEMKDFIAGKFGHAIDTKYPSQKSLESSISKFGADISAAQMETNANIRHMSRSLSSIASSLSVISASPRSLHEDSHNIRPLSSEAGHNNVDAQSFAIFPQTMADIHNGELS